MGVYIKGMEMPKDCIVCPFGWNGCNNHHDFVYMGSRPDNCPLIELPPHGRLIDVDELIDRGFQLVRDNIFTGVFETVLLSSVPTVIEAEEDKT